MASSKKKHKAAAAERRLRQAGAPPRPHPDGDRRRRAFGQMAREVLKLKEALRNGELPAPPEPGPPDAR